MPEDIEEALRLASPDTDHVPHNEDTPRSECFGKTVSREILLRAELARALQQLQQAVIEHKVREADYRNPNPIPARSAIDTVLAARDKAIAARAVKYCERVVRSARIALAEWEACK